MEQKIALNRRSEVWQRCIMLGRDRTLAANIDRLTNVLEASDLLDKDLDDGDDNSDALNGIDLADFGRRIQIPLSSGLDVDEIHAVNEACIAEANLVNLIHEEIAKSLLECSPVLGALSDTELTAPDMLTLFQLSKENINKRTEDVFDRTGLVKDIDSARASANWWPVLMQATLEDFADVCENPNNLEIMMLARFFQRSVAEVYEWFVLRRKENKAIRDMRTVLQNKAGATARMHRAWQGLTTLGVQPKK